MQNPHKPAENNEPAKVHGDILPGDDKGSAGVDDSDTDGSEKRGVGMSGIIWVVTAPADIHPPDKRIQKQAGHKASRDNVN